MVRKIGKDKECRESMQVNKKPKGAIDLVYCRSVTKDGIEKAQKQWSLVFVENTRAMLLTRLQ